MIANTKIILLIALLGAVVSGAKNGLRGFRGDNKSQHDEGKIGNKNTNSKKESIVPTEKLSKQGSAVDPKAALIQQIPEEVRKLMLRNIVAQTGVAGLISQIIDTEKQLLFPDREPPTDFFAQRTSDLQKLSEEQLKTELSTTKLVIPHIKMMWSSSDSEALEKWISNLQSSDVIAAYNHIEEKTNEKNTASKRREDKYRFQDPDTYEYPHMYDHHRAKEESRRSDINQKEGEDLLMFNQMLQYPQDINRKKDGNQYMFDSDEDRNNSSDGYYQEEYYQEESRSPLADEIIQPIMIQVYNALDSRYFRSTYSEIPPIKGRIQEFRIKASSHGFKQLLHDTLFQIYRSQIDQATEFFDFGSAKSVVESAEFQSIQDSELKAEIKQIWQNAKPKPSCHLCCQRNTNEREYGSPCEENESSFRNIECANYVWPHDGESWYSFCNSKCKSASCNLGSSGLSTCVDK